MGFRTSECGILLKCIYFGSEVQYGPEVNFGSDVYFGSDIQKWHFGTSEPSYTWVPKCNFGAEVSENSVFRSTGAGGSRLVLLESVRCNDAR